MVKCRWCAKTGNYAAVCRSKLSGTSAAVSAVKADEAFLRALTFGSAWTKRIFINGKLVEMKVDTGAEVTAIPEATYRRMLQSTLMLSKANRILRGPVGK